MTFNKEQMEVLSAWEDNFKSAINANWSRSIGMSGYTTMHGILQDATGKKMPFRPSCGNCMLNLIRETGRIYFKDKEEMESHNVEVAETEVKVKKVTVKVKKTKKSE